ncbi:hypothetical protein GA0070609_5701 [Micromonospora echinaurantiaca]|uniref:Uncharacterized protein n=1 Tax=Micromonospora echinaurantiaca TaxID=47857 RepID=A0A1C5K8N8_9ACTN|nr:hypothetical protein [Micromonospora echinaurantiaca]SCG78826.1 hypothetical protein GA0070609_5701 [Micromonospora echinaurantiaca]
MTATSTPYADWADPHRQATAHDGVTDQLGRHGRRVTGPVEPRIRPWSLPGHPAAGPAGHLRVRTGQSAVGRA